MKKNELFENAMGLIDDAFIADAKAPLPIAKHPSRRLIPWIAAACILLMLSVIPLTLWFNHKKSPLPPPNITSANTATTTANSDNTVEVTANIELPAPPTTSRDPRPSVISPIYSFEGDPDSIETPTSEWSGLRPVTSFFSFSLTCHVEEVLPDRYRPIEEFNTQRIGLVKVKTQTLLFGNEISDEFYLMLPSEFMTDLTRYPHLILKSIDQKTHDYFVVYNETDECYESFPLPLYAFKNDRVSIYAYDENGNFDLTLWKSNDAWNSHTASLQEALREEGNFASLSLSEAEESIQKSYDSYGYSDLKERTLAIQNETAAERLSYYRNLNNGIYVPPLEKQLHQNNNTAKNYLFRRYINGFPTNEVIGNSLSAPKVTFDENDISHLPDLAFAMEEVSRDYHEGNIKPPHILHLSHDHLASYGILGWYAKTENGVLGIVRVSFRYQIPMSDTFDPNNSFYDDCYFIIEYSSHEITPIDRDELLLKVQNTDTSYIFSGNYDENGKILAYWAA